MPKDCRLYLDDIHESILVIQSYTRDMTFETFSTDRKTLDAVVRNLEVVGEAAGHLSEEVRSKAPDVEWKKISNLRNILIHEYFGVNKQIVWDVVTNKLPSLDTVCERLIRQLSRS